MQKHFLAGLLGLALGLAGGWAAAQTAAPDKALPTKPSGTDPKAGGQGKPSGADQTVPLKNPVNRNPARRQRAPDSAMPPAPDPRDSTTRPVAPPGDDGRDAVPPEPDMAQAPSS
ncbi:hypothetical protein [Polaromonas jejuensis]|uniref:Translation initiation factor IF-2 n=1 Tax=Polaromonas jejuensis TaxID=457502 RepID=A0ABW0QGV4_9BURK|nr:hypothetical protein [Polaromonas jejuensis]